MNASKLRNKMKCDKIEATPTNLLLPRKCITACVFSPVLYGSLLSLDSVSEVRLMLFLCVFLAVAASYQY